MVFLDRPHHMLITPVQRWKRMGIFLSMRTIWCVCVFMCKSRYRQKLTGSANFAQCEWCVSLPAVFWLSPWKHTKDWGSEIAVGGKVTWFALCCNSGQRRCGSCPLGPKWQNRHYSSEELSTGLWIIAQTKHWYQHVQSVCLGCKVSLQVCFDTCGGQYGSPAVILTGRASKTLWQWCSRPFFWCLIYTWDLSASSWCELLAVQTWSQNCLISPRLSFHVGCEAVKY